MDREGGPEPGNSKIVSLDVPSIYRLGRFEVYIYIYLIYHPQILSQCISGTTRL